MGLVVFLMGLQVDMVWHGGCGGGCWLVFGGLNGM